jgi:hypothetical protein
VKRCDSLGQVAFVIGECHKLGHQLPLEPFCLTQYQRWQA